MKESLISWNGKKHLISFYCIISYLCRSCNLFVRIRKVWLSCQDCNDLFFGFLRSTISWKNLQPFNEQYHLAVESDGHTSSPLPARRTTTPFKNGNRLWSDCEFSQTKQFVGRMGHYFSTRHFLHSKTTLNTSWTCFVWLQSLIDILWERLMAEERLWDGGVKSENLKSQFIQKSSANNFAIVSVWLKTILPNDIRPQIPIRSLRHTKASHNICL